MAERRIVLKHALRNALIPVITVTGLQFGTLLGGAVLTGKVFAWPGIGRLMVEAIIARDYPVVQGAVLSWRWRSFASICSSTFYTRTSIRPSATNEGG